MDMESGLHLMFDVVCCVYMRFVFIRCVVCMHVLHLWHACTWCCSVYGVRVCVFVFTWVTCVMCYVCNLVHVFWWVVWSVYMCYMYVVYAYGCVVHVCACVQLHVVLCRYFCTWGCMQLIRKTQHHLDTSGRFIPPCLPLFLCWRLASRELTAGAHFPHPTT